MGNTQAVIGGAAPVFHSWLAEESGSGQHTDHSDITDSIAATSLRTVYSLRP